MTSHSPNPDAPLDVLETALRQARPEARGALVASVLAWAAAKLAAAQAAPPAPAEPGVSGPDANLSAPEAARRLGVSMDWLYKHASGLPFTIRIGRRLLFSSRGLERWNRLRQGRR